MNELLPYRWRATSFPRAVGSVSELHLVPARGSVLTDEVTGPSCAEVPLAVKLTPLGALSLTSRAAGRALVVARAGPMRASDLRQCGRSPC
jgi:hypothetical protein